MKFGLGWKPDHLDHRDHVYGSLAYTAGIEIDLRDSMPAVYDQGPTNSCVANTIAAAVEYLRLRESLADWVPSRMFIYWQARAIEQCANVDEGCQIRDAIKVVANVGVPDETLWPFDLKAVNKTPNLVALTAARHSMVTQYARINDNNRRGSILSCLQHHGPVAFGASVFAAMDSDEVARTGIVPMPSPTDEPQGGHAMLIVGHNPTTREFIVRNSWGPNWGLGGYCFFPEDYILNPDLTDDLWTLWYVARN